jgi:hypothetical protein
LRVVRESEVGAGDRWAPVRRDPAALSIAELIGL